MKEEKKLEKLLDTSTLFARLQSTLFIMSDGELKSQLQEFQRDLEISS
ncbi:hypothetical protein BVRB_5g110250 isoform B [Beta vulgaris subsp. vulgaris]|uniref:Uncharacterized protein n=1 Tax=Beta vulgaris subsp. vulgaris TaxID=3555 RepID=A0A0J8CGU4_BETVV|nr:hypothetical protein BVRB_5g110250 isoform B [Beta vulgaris subsp. vulgaris]